MKTHRKIVAMAGFGLLLIMLIVGFSLRNGTSAFSTLIAILLTSAGVLIVFAISLYRTVAVPLSELLDGARKLHGGNPDDRLQKTSDIAQLAAHLDGIADKLKCSCTEAKQASEKYRDLFENTRDILFTMDTNCNFTAVNRTTELFTGYSKIELIGKKVRDFLTPEGAAMGKDLLGGEEIKPRRLIEFEVIKRDMSRAFLEVSLLKLFKDQVLTGFQVSARDITEQRNLREMIVKAERLGVIGQGGAAIRHEINNPLTTVIGNVELLIERYEPKDKDLTARLEVVLNNALRIAEITKRPQEIKKENIADSRTGVNMTDPTER